MGTFDLVSWSYPDEGSLLDQIEKYRLHPITAIPELRKSDIVHLIDQGIIICSDLAAHPKVLDKINVRKSRQQAILESLEMICGA
jgi:hypothetical protein